MVQGLAGLECQWHGLGMQERGLGMQEHGLGMQEHGPRLGLRLELRPALGHGGENLGAGSPGPAHAGEMAASFQAVANLNLNHFTLKIALFITFTVRGGRNGFGLAIVRVKLTRCVHLYCLVELMNRWMTFLF